MKLSAFLPLWSSRLDEPLTERVGAFFGPTMACAAAYSMCLPDVASSMPVAFRRMVLPPPLSMSSSLAVMVILLAT
ncbi:hypothetical protein D3C71_1459340 [compost metagenome]